MSSDAAPAPPLPLDRRAVSVRDWAFAELSLKEANFAPASADASFRRYFRIRNAGHSWIVMDAPPELEDCRPFLRVAGLMRDAGVNVPQVLATDLERGYLLLSDLGCQTLLEVLNSDNADAHYQAAIDTLINWQKASRPDVLPAYDEILLKRELELFPHWYLQRHLGVALTAQERSALAAVSSALVHAALAQPQVYVHRDFMPRNLMPANPEPGVLDFQDAVYGPLAYDPLCLFKDAFLSWPEARVQAWLADYHARAGRAGIAVPAWPQFQRDCDWIGIHRHLKVLGIFARLTHRDGKPKYVADTPRFVRYIMDVAPRHESLAPLVALFERHVLPRVFP